MTGEKSASKPVLSKPAVWAKIGEGQWYAIPPKMADIFRQAGAEVRDSIEQPNGED